MVITNIVQLMDFPFKPTAISQIGQALKGHLLEGVPAWQLLSALPRTQARHSGTRQLDLFAQVK